MSKGIFLAARRCCKKIRIKIWHHGAGIAEVERDVEQLLREYGVRTDSRRHTAGGPATPPSVVFLFKLAGGETEVADLSAKLERAGYEPF